MKTRLLSMLLCLILSSLHAQSPIGTPIITGVNEPITLKNDGTNIYTYYNETPRRNIARFNPNATTPSLENVILNQFDGAWGFEFINNNDALLVTQHVVDEITTVNISNGLPGSTTPSYFLNDVRLIGETENNGIWVVYINNSNGQRELGSLNTTTGVTTPRGSFFGAFPVGMIVDGDDLYVTLLDGNNNGNVYKVSTQNPAIAGPTPKTIIQSGQDNPYGIALTNNRIYYTLYRTAGTSKIVWVPKSDPTATPTEFATGQPRLSGLTIIDQDIYASALDDDEILKFTDTSISPCTSISSLTATNTNGTSTLLTWDANTDANDYTIVVVPSGQPISNGTPENSPTNSFTANTLTANTFYDAYVRSSCTANGILEDSAYTKLTFNSSGNSQTIFHVNPDATGNGTGVSWGDGFLDLRDALLAADGVANAEVWIKSGFYRPRLSTSNTSVTDRRSSFDVTQSNIKIVGGFAGTELDKDSRHINENRTVLTGDVDLDDNGTVTFFSSAASSDNVYTVVKLSGDNVEFDGLYIEGGRSNVTGGAPFLTPYNRDGGGMYIFDDVTSITIKNCTFQNNSAAFGGGAIFKRSGANATGFTLNIDKTVFKNNQSRLGGAIYAFTDPDDSAAVTITNSVFDNNLTEDIVASIKGFGGSALWLRSNGANSVFDFYSVNNTVVNNKDLGTEPGFQRSPFGFTDDAGEMNAYIYNTLFFSNTTIGNVISNPITAVTNSGSIHILDIRNSAEDAGFTNLLSNATTSNTVTASGLFFDASHGNYTPSVGAVELNSGDNALANTYSSTTDLLNNPRFDPITSNIDIGAFENQNPNLANYSLTINIVGNGSVTPINGNYFAGDVVTLSAVADTNFIFEGYTGDLVSTSANETITINSDVNITATFVGNGPAVYVKWDATGANDGTSWEDAYNDLQNGINDATEFNRIWVAEGRYFAGVNRQDAFQLTENAKIYGGFNGTETQFNQRSLIDQKAIIDGDLNGDDPTTKPIVNEAARGDNSQTLIHVTGNNTSIEGFILRNAYANSTSGTLASSGGAIYKADNVTDLMIRHTLFEDNYAQRAGAIMNTWFNQNQNEMILESNIFRNNVSNYGGIYVVLNSGQPNLDLSVNNNVFEGNEAIDTDTAGYGASSIWLRPITVNTSINATIANNTFFANRDAGTNSVGTNLSTIAIDEGQGASFNGVIANSIFWNNTDGSGTLNDVISTNLSNTAVGTLEVRNSTSDLGFANLSQPTLFNTSSGDPLFVNSAVGNFNLQDSSPARNTGDALFSNFIPTDIEGKPRLIGIIDQGAYENQTVVSTFDLTITTVGNGTVTPSSGTTFNSGDTANLNATPDTGWQFDGWSG
ncbi:MAG: hypothetical protein WA775_05540, partial [Psychroserpens sp.]|uniref:beta strand repeat-containing protein n=1 Tax=Psychroserpens sp. TaxID=2020870 RepID=UPI003CC2A5C9